jgi:hypothetical protein
LKGFFQEQVHGFYNSIHWLGSGSYTVGMASNTVVGLNIQSSYPFDARFVSFDPTFLLGTAIGMVFPVEWTGIMSSPTYTWEHYGGKLWTYVVGDSLHLASNVGIYGKSTVEIDGLQSVSVQSGASISLGIGGGACFSTLTLNTTGVEMTAGGAAPVGSVSVDSGNITLFGTAVPIDILTISKTIRLQAASQSLNLSSTGLKIDALESLINGERIQLGQPAVPAVVPSPPPPPPQEQSMWAGLWETITGMM